ncbi:MAG: YidB family protein [Bacteroidota bacterium]|nr:YidB family protein [Bacteroidota bacterium]MDP4233060.1 YidB family protein [Bacteroidota bacterium]MDP4241795.1 YidB family protein [Bacteroidota bacterium]MDP4288784.1 YidB family protein [Bacteroidota bacterium]
MNNSNVTSDGTREMISHGIAQTVGSPSRGEVTSSTQSALMGIVLARIESGQLSFSSLVNRFNELAPEATRTWIGPGINAAITAAEVERILGPRDLASISNEAGLPASEVSVELAQLLPTIIDKFTPEGSLPDAPLVRQAAGDLRTKIS